MNNFETFQSVLAYFQKSPLTINYNYINTLLEKTEQYSVISFDIFDTLITRIFECPIDLFAYVESLLLENNIILDNYAKNRLYAEETARKTAIKNENREEVTIEEIYLHLSNYYPNKTKELLKAQKHELDAEIQSIIPIHENIELIKKLKQNGKKIIFVSDIYFNKNFLKEILEKNNLNIYDTLYISSELMKTKNTGRIWETILNDFPNHNLFHIGDNVHSDVLKPKEFNIQTYHYAHFLSERRFGADLSPNLVPFSLVSKMKLIKNNYDTINEQSNFWFGLGETLGAFLLQSFIDWLKKEIYKDGIEHIYFCARDSQVIKKVWDELNYNSETNTTSSYLYLSRKILKFSSCFIDLEKDNKFSNNSLEFLVNESIQLGDSYKTYFLRIGILDSDILSQTNFIKFFGSLDNIIEYKDYDKIKEFLQGEVLFLLKEIFKIKYEQTCAYFKQEGVFDSKKIAIVDLGWGGSIQQSISDLRVYNNTKGKIYGYYYGLFNHNAVGKLYKNGSMKSSFFNKFLSHKDQYALQNSVNILENLHSANHETTQGFTLDKKSNTYIPVLKNDQKNQYIEQYNKTFKIFQDGVFSSILKWSKNETVYGLNKDMINSKVAVAGLLQITISPNKLEKKYLGTIQHAAMFDHLQYYSLINFTIPQSIDDIDKAFYLGGWQCGQMSYFKENSSEIDASLYQYATNFFQSYPKFIYQNLIG